MQVEFSKKNENPFYGMRNCLSLYQQGTKGMVSDSTLNAALAECKTKEQKQMFYSLLFSIGDITARQHYIFGKKKVDTGGNAQRQGFMDVVSWIKRTNSSQFKNFLFSGLFNQYTSFDTLLANRVKTTGRKKAKVEKVYNMLDGNTDDLALYVANIIRGDNPADKYFVAKFLTRPRMSVRTGHKKMLPDTRKVMQKRQDFIKLVSDKAGLSYDNKGKYIDFTGYYNWRKEYNGTLESVLFSSNKIKEFKKDEFLAWLDKLPAGARFRVRLRLLTKSNQPKSPKWGELSQWFLEWEAFKGQKQSEQRVLEEKVRQGTATEKDITTLKEVIKEAKVTVGAVNFAGMMDEIVRGTIDKAKVQPFLDKVNLPFNFLTFLDDSGSMMGGRGHKFTPFEFGVFMTTLCLTKNPSDTGRSMIGFFSSTCRMFSSMDEKSITKNSLLAAKSVQVSEPFIKPELHFLDNLQRVKDFCYAKRTGNGTNISSVLRHLTIQMESNSTLIEELAQFPVWCFISDGNFNNESSVTSSILDFMKLAENKLGFKPFFLLIDVAYSTSADIKQFAGVDNVMMVPPNPAQIEQIIMNFKDIQVFDVYTPLQALHDSNRYELVRKHTI